MSEVIRAVLSNSQHSEYGQVSISFPIPTEEYDETIEILQEKDVGCSANRDCIVDGVESAYDVLNALKGTLVNVDELDYLAKRLDSFCTGEDIQFVAMAHRLALTDIKDFINLTFCCQQATVITSFADLERIGKDHIMTLNGGGMPMDQYQAIDGKAEALRLIQGGGGMITPYGVVYDNGMVLEQLYNGHQFPAYPYDSSLMVLEVTPKQGLPEGKNPEYLYLPAAAQQIERTLLRVGVDAPHNAQVRLDFDELPDIVADKLDLEHLSGDDIPELNRMCQSIQLLAGEDIEKLNAVALMAGASGAGSICRLAEKLDQFDFISSAQTQESGGHLNECGYVSYHGAMPLEELMGEEPAEQPEQEMRMM